MTTEEKKEELKKMVTEILTDSHNYMLNKIDRALNSGAIDVESWDKSNGKWILPKTIATAILIDASTKHNASGTSFEKQQKKDVKNLLLFI